MFEGYVGIRLWDGQGVDDLVFTLLIVLFVSFALVFRTHTRLFIRMTRDVIYVKERENLFENVKGSEFFFHNFMIAHALILCGLCMFSIIRAEGTYTQLMEEKTLPSLALIVGVIILYYVFKNLLYAIFSFVFLDAEKFKFWKVSYNAIIGTWGISLYIPVLWLIFVNTNIQIPVILFAFFYLASRFVIIYKTVRIFHKKNDGYLYLSLYLCGQEILPLYFLGKAIMICITLYESSTLWQ